MTPVASNSTNAQTDLQIPTIAIAFESRNSHDYSGIGFFPIGRLNFSFESIYYILERAETLNIFLKFDVYNTNIW